MMAQKSFAFQTYNSNSATIRTRTTELRALVDPDMASTVSSDVTHPELHTLLSTMLSTTNLQPAVGHSNPLFGPPDPILAAGKSIAPSAKALSDMGITHAKTASDFAPDTSPAFQQTVASVMDKGWKVLNNANIMNGGAPSLPGFSETQGILPTHSLNVPAETPASFAAEVQWAANYFDVMDKLPYAAFWYCMVEFFILRPGIDFYKEDIEADPTGVLADTVAVAGVRVIAIAIISFLTVAFYG
jgi:hypothetical protein